MKKHYPIAILFFIMLLNASNMQAQSEISFSTQTKTVTIRLKPGEDLKESLDNFIKLHHITAACILTCVGSLQQAVIRYANQPNTDTLVGHFEIVSLTGTLATSGSHLHISISDSTGKTIGGHLKEGAKVYTTAEIVLAVFPDIEYTREIDPTFGYKELAVKKLKMVGERRKSKKTVGSKSE